ncbi:hypothetical protein V2P57_05190 [Mycoplasma mycoides subsp. mycoides]|uniref:Uncharacterized protein n=2 Tax=Mycoplasma mycoides subsp. mycoides TaxID=2103 RepID=Q6MRT9_MYCMS|nr:hypothetical protein [Mycoplasma mycoides]QQY78219.1 hypothetical protein JLS56_05065 [Mycoplasma mycoides subsp. capri]CAE77629.1 Hypothetical protein MSC_1023 [Mycoplasma mycoides subsp. mycoides SC str. PG1]ADK69901.1 conserved hypothetical protein [Mycoplasma mycoides subsp. mycoides SC str. Gladysdale]AMK56071.1 hypothetical protein MSCT144_01490 [Mycoplasma mycoides subsp. mycoides]KJQ45556.1 hypothetical protein TS60_1135 [Mycoplasma mycoides subsp. mycoides]
MKIWDKKGLLHVKPEITNQIRHTHLPLLEDYSKRIEEELRVLDYFEDVLVNIMSIFDKKYDENTFKINDNNH